MKNKILKQKLKEIEDIADFTTSAIEVAANSCSYKNDYTTEDVLRLVLDKQYDMIEKISHLRFFPD